MYKMGYSKKFPTLFPTLMGKITGQSGEFLQGTA